MPIVTGEFRDHFTVEVEEMPNQYGKYTLYVDLGEEVKIFIRYSKSGEKYPCKELKMEISGITRRGCWRRITKPKEKLESWKNKQGLGHCVVFHDWQRPDIHRLFVDLGTEVIIEIRRYTGKLLWGHWPELKSNTEIGTITANGTWKRNIKPKEESISVNPPLAD
ncbi:MAG: hypothetical protein WC460_04105 [Patescibacteria group bacterium]